MIERASKPSRATVPLIEDTLHVYCIKNNESWLAIYFFQRNIRVAGRARLVLSPTIRDVERITPVFSKTLNRKSSKDHPQDADLLPFPVHIAKTGRNNLNEEITSILHYGIGKRYSQTIY